MDAAELALIRKTFESALANPSGETVALLGELGWSDLHHAEPAVAVGELFEAQGRLGVTTSALDVVVAAALGCPLPGRTVVVHPGLGAWDRPPGTTDPDGGFRLDGLVLAGTRRADGMLVPLAGGKGELGLVRVDVADTDIEVRPIQGLDPALRLVAVSGHLDSAATETTIASDSWAAVTAAARRALAHELCGLTHAILDQAAAHVTERHQFGRPIAAFQTVRHRLTEVYVALASTRAALDASWATGDPLLGDAAKALAGQAGLLAGRHCLQVTGAIGFTEEYQLAARIRRLSLLDALYGTADQLQSALGARLLAERRVPRPYPLP